MSIFLNSSAESDKVSRQKIINFNSRMFLKQLLDVVYNVLNKLLLLWIIFASFVQLLTMICCDFVCTAVLLEKSRFS